MSGAGCGGGYTGSDAACFDAINAVLGHIAHDFGNLLTPLIAYPELIRADLPAGSAARGMLEQIELTTASMARIVEHLQVLTSREAPDARPPDLAALVGYAVSDLRAGGLPAGVDLTMMPVTASVPVQGSTTPMDVAIRHVVQNALEAVSQGGAVRVEVARAVLPAHVSSSGLATAGGEFGVLRVCDSGPGIPETVRGSEFEPFVTTKKSARRRGAGLGLSIVYKVMREHGGLADILSRPEGGTEVRLSFPVAEATA